MFRDQQTLRVTGLPIRADKDDIRDFFRRRITDQGADVVQVIGPICKELGKNTSQATVTFSSSYLAQQALQLSHSDRLLIAADGIFETIDIDQDFKGMTTVQKFTNPATGKPDIDIVCLHGLKGHAWNTFTARDGPYENMNTVRENNWLQENLPRLLLQNGAKKIHARVMTFGYDANVWMSKSTAAIEEPVRHLLQCLKSERHNVSDHPLFFIAHDLGGIVVKQAIIEMKKDAILDSMNPTPVGLVVPVKGCLFFGVPNKVVKPANNAFGPFPDLMRSFSVNKYEIGHTQHQSDKVVSILSEFEDVQSSLKTPILSFYGNNVTGHKKVIAVDKESAVFDYPDKPEPFGVDKDHRDMVKFVDENDLALQTAMGFLLGLAFYAIESQNSSNSARSSTPSLQPKDKTRQFAGYDLSILQGCDTTFLIDDSPSMTGQRWEILKNVLYSCISVATHYSRDGFDICFMNNRHFDEFNVKRPDMAVQICNNIELHGTTPLLASLSHRLRSYFRAYKRSDFATNFKRYNLIILTDGESDMEYSGSEEDEDSDYSITDYSIKPGFNAIRKKITHYARRLDDVDAPRDQIQIQFCQIGTDKNAKEFFQSFDTSKDMRKTDRNIVDTIVCESESDLTDSFIRKLLIGDINKGHRTSTLEELHEGPQRAETRDSSFTPPMLRPPPARSDILGSTYTSVYSDATTTDSILSNTSVGARVPEELYSLLIHKVLLHPEVTRLSEEILRNNGTDFLVEKLEGSIKRFCQNLNAQNPNQIQKGAIQILRRRCKYFANCITSLVDRNASPPGNMSTHLPAHASGGIAKVEDFLHTLKINTLARSDREQNSNFRDNADDRDDTLASSDEEIDDDDNIDEDQEDRYVSNSNMTVETISWLAGSMARNFMFDLTRVISSPMQYVERALRFALSSLPSSKTTFILPPGIMDYAKTQLENIEQISTVLTLSGHASCAEASTCHDYCKRVWPMDGPAVVKALQSAITDDRHNCTLPSKTFLRIRIGTTTAPSKSALNIDIKGTNENIIRIAQQLAWLSTVFRVPKDGNLSFSTFSIFQLADSANFEIAPLKLKHVHQDSNSCWQALFRNWVMAEGFPTCPRQGGNGLELPFQAMTQLSEILGPVTYRDGFVLTGHSSILFPVQSPKTSNNSPPIFGQWHLIHSENREFANLTLLDKMKNRWLCQITDLENLTRVRTFLGSYKHVSIHLATQDGIYSSFQRPNTRHSAPRPELSGHSFGASLTRIFGINASVNFTIPKNAPIERDFGPYEQALAHLSKLPVILYDTHDRRAWMVPALSVVHHMVHIWYHMFKDNFPTHIDQPPYGSAVSDIGKESCTVLSVNKDYQLYQTLQNGSSYSLGDHVTRYCLDFKKLLATPRYHNGIGADKVIGFNLLDIIEAKVGDPKTPIHTFKGNWKALAQHSDMIVLFGHRLGDVIVPDVNEQKVCRQWNTVPTQKDYLTASIRCLRRCTLEFSIAGDAATQNDRRLSMFEDCRHEGDSPSQPHARHLWTEAEVTSIDYTRDSEGAIVFGAQESNKLRKMPRKI